MPNTANSSNSRSSVVLHPDCFGNLPIEIRLQIATYLPTVDFLSLRQSSRAMVVAFEFQSFWKSRFSVNGDRGFLNSLVTNSRKHESRDWRGFTVIVGEAGIHAIRPIFNKNTTTSWIGLPNGSGIGTTTMVLGQGIKAISGNFNVSHVHAPAKRVA